MSIEMPSSFRALAESMHVANPQAQWEALVERNRNEMPEPFSWRKWLERAPKKSAGEGKQEPITVKHHPQFPPMPMRDWEKKKLTEEERAQSVAMGTAAIEMLEAMSKPKTAPSTRRWILTEPPAPLPPLPIVEDRTHEQMVADGDAIVGDEHIAIIESTGKGFELTQQLIADEACRRANEATVDVITCVDANDFEQAVPSQENLRKAIDYFRGERMRVPPKIEIIGPVPPSMGDAIQRELDRLEGEVLAACRMPSTQESKEVSDEAVDDSQDASEPAFTEGDAGDDDLLVD